MKLLEGKYALVTGGAKGIGAAVVKKFLENGIAGVAMFDIDEKQLELTAREIDPERTCTYTFACDVSNQEQVKEVIKHVYETFDSIDILINNAGITRDAMFHKMTDEQWKQVIDINLNGLYYVTKEVVDNMRTAGYGKIVNVSSVSSMGNIGQANYAASKAAVRGFTYTLSKELGPKGIYVNAVAPGFIKTDMLSTVPYNIIKKWKELTPLKRLGSAEELANVIVFLSSDMSSWITGECITVSGGVKEF